MPASPAGIRGFGGLGAGEIGKCLACGVGHLGCHPSIREALIQLSSEEVLLIRIVICGWAILLIVVGLRLCGHRHFRLENVRLPPVSLAAEICSVLRFAYPAGKGRVSHQIWNEKRPLRIPKRCVLHGYWEISFPLS